MDFEQITLVSESSYHTYLIQGKCNITFHQDNPFLLLDCELTEPIQLENKLYSIEINGITFDCIDIHLVHDKVTGKIADISAYMYAKQIKLFTEHSH